MRKENDPAPNSLESEAKHIKQQNPAQKRSARLQEVDRELKRFNENETNNIDEIEIKRTKEFESKKQELEKAGIKISNESCDLIYQNLVDDYIDYAKNENERFDSLQAEKKKIVLYNNLELGENPEIFIEKAKKAIKNQDINGEKIKIFNEALEYYSKSCEKVANVPIYHGTGSSSLYKIIEKGILDSRKSILGGEKDVTGKSHGGTSFAIGGYEQSEIVSHLYARMNERKSRLVVDSKSIFGDNIASGKEIIDVIYRELPKLKPEEKQFVEEKLKKVNTEDVINLFDNEKYYFDYDAVHNELQESRDKLEGKRGEITSDEYRRELEKKIPNLENKIEAYDKTTDEEKKLLNNPFGVVLVYEGDELPKKDLETFTTAGICERRTNEPISNSKIKQIHIPYSEINQVRGWIDKKILRLPENSEERTALENVEIIPLEYFEVKSIIRNI